MSARHREAHENLCRDLLASATRRLDDLRTAVERSKADDQADLERALDSLRGLHNRALARMEAAHLADDESWPPARAQADQALAALTRGLDEVQARIPVRRAA